MEVALVSRPAVAGASGPRRFSPVPRRILIAAAIITAIVPGFPACNAQETQATYPVRGVVLNSITHRPIARALVDGHFDAALTDNDGRFEINLNQGFTQILVRRIGYNPNGPQVQHLLKMGPNMPELTFYLTPEASVTVHVSLSGGDAADGIRFIAYRKRVQGGHGVWMQQGNFTTDSEGSFRMVNLESPAAYVLCSMASAESTLPVESGKTTYGYPQTCYPGVTDLSAATPISVLPGQQSEAEITLTKQPFYPVSILMPNRGQGQFGGVSIMDQGGRGMGFPVRINSQQGLVEANLPNGRYYAESRSNNGKSQTYGRTDFQVSGGPVVGLTLVQHPLAPIQVEIHRDFTPGANQVWDAFNSSIGNDNNPGLNINLVSADGSPMNMGGHNLQRPVGSSDSNLFEMTDVVPGRSWVQTFASQGYVASISAGGVDLAREPLVIGPGGATAPIEIYLSNNGGQIKGTLNPSAQQNSASGTDDGQTSMVFAYAIPQFPSSAQMQMSATQGSGTLMFGNLAPGTYRVVALDKPEEIDMDDPAAMARWSAHGQLVTVEPGATASVQLDVFQTADSAEEGSVH
jgi:hypothetical protein